ncbi:MAG: PilT/PilU family type 4a pilus ATPase [Proteobacteria bacterium]|nr:PilT/PilU family type 4a pilus ATPase [Pseudomonadota bacterium]
MEFRDLVDSLHDVLAAAVREDASDIYIRAGLAPCLRIEGGLAFIEMDPLRPEVTEAICQLVMKPAHREAFEKRPEANLVYEVEGVGRFRCNVYRQRGTWAMVMRKVRDEILDFEALRIPDVAKKLSLLKRGLVLVTGPTGSGKSTTLAAMVKYRNQNSTGHIVTIEDPIEYLHTDLNCIVSQREVGTDTVNFQDALESALRQAPDVLLIGEMRDQQSVKAAVYFAETGHLVLSTLHSNNATQTVERVVQFFPTEIHDQVYAQLSLNLRGVVSQRLVPRSDIEGRVAAVEVMTVNARVQELLRSGELTQLKRELDLFAPEGMQSFDASLLALYREGLISPEDAVRFSDNANDMRLKLKTMPVYIKSSGREDPRYQSTPYQSVGPRRGDAGAPAAVEGDERTS